MGGVCSVFCRRRDSPPGSWIMVAWLWVVLVVGVEILSLLFFFQCVACVCVWLVVVLGFLLAAHAGALILVCLVMCVRVLCENSIVCQCTFVLVAAGATGVVVVALIIMTRLFIT